MEGEEAPIRKKPQRQGPKKKLSVLREHNEFSEEDSLSQLRKGFGQSESEGADEDSDGLSEDINPFSDRNPPKFRNRRASEKCIVEIRAQDMKAHGDWRDVAVAFEPGRDDRYSLCIFQELLLTVTNGLDKMYQVTLDQAFLEAHREQINIEGSWCSYFDLLRQALDLKSLSLCRGDRGLHLKIHYPLMAGATISGQMALNSRDERGSDDRYEVRGLDRQTTIQDMLIRLVNNCEGLDGTSRQVIAQAEMY